MNIEIFDTKRELGVRAASLIAEKLKKAVSEKGEACMVMATGASQFDTIEALLNQPVDWSRVVCFHMDEYIGIDARHPASFRRYLKERFVDSVKGLREFHYVDGSNPDPEKECERLQELISKHEIDVVQGGIGENGHLAFNDPPADFETEKSYIVVDLDEACRRQQFNEGWFENMDEVPRKAISISIRQIMKAKSIVCSVPDQRKAKAIYNCLNGELSAMHPASILRQHPECHLLLDKPAASLLQDEGK